MKMNLKGLLLLTGMLVAMGFPRQLFCNGNPQCPFSFHQMSETWKGRLRTNTLKNLDQLLNWGAGHLPRTYPLVHPLQQQKIEMDIPEIGEFVEKYGYFSPLHPIVSKTTMKEKDLALACWLLKILHDKGAQGEYLKIATAEILTKIIAYRELKVGQAIPIPLEKKGKVFLELFTVDKVFDIGHGMPAFGLVPLSSGVASILLFRGTDFSFGTERGWASILSDLDMAGPGLSTFRKSQGQLSDWLKKVKEAEKSARVMGFSLGGALAAYTFIYENALLAEGGSLAVCAPGVADNVVENFKALAAEKRAGFTSYVNAGDLVSKVGRLFGTVYCLSLERSLKPLTAHTLLMCSFPVFSQALIDVDSNL
jgi:hypothetical protein